MPTNNLLQTTPIIWTIMHPDIGGPLNVVAESAYVSVKQELELVKAEIADYKNTLEKIKIVGLNLDESEGEDSYTLVQIAKSGLEKWKKHDKK